MTGPTINTHSTVRGGMPTIIPAQQPTKATRFQPDTPVNKKFTPQKPTPKKRQAKPKNQTTDPPPEPLGDKPNGPAPPS